MEADVDSKLNDGNLPKIKALKEHKKCEITITKYIIPINLSFVALLASNISQHFEFDKSGNKMPANSSLSQPHLFEASRYISDWCFIE